MAEQRQPFRFRLPWLPAPEPTPAPPRPSQETQTPPPPAPAQRPPFRPAGVAPAQPPTRSEARPPSQPRPTSQAPAQIQGPMPSQSPQASPTRAAPKPKISATSPSKPSEASQPPSQTRPTSQAPAQIQGPIPSQSPQASPTRAAPKPKVSATSPSKPSEVSQPPSQPRPTSQAPAQIQGPMPSQSPQASPTLPAPKPKVSATSPPRPSEAKSQSPTMIPKSQIQRPEPKGPTELATRVPTPEPEVYQTTSDGGPRVTRGMNQDEPEEKKVIDSHSSPLTSKPKGHPVVIGDEQVHKPASHREMKEGSQRLSHKLGSQGDKHPAQEKPLSIITLTGENTGATMHLSCESGTRERSIHIHRGYRLNPEENVDTTTDGEGSSRGRNSEDSKLEQELRSKLYVNNNAQGVNNSLVYNSSVTERNPGVHVVVSRDSGPIEPSKETETIRAQKVEVGSTMSEKLTYAPTVRRRCLRGLFLESSDSDPENPDKPRRHGCRVGCGQKGKDVSDVI